MDRRDASSLTTERGGELMPAVHKNINERMASLETGVNALADKFGEYIERQDGINDRLSKCVHSLRDLVKEGITLSGERDRAEAERLERKEKKVAQALGRRRWWLAVIAVSIPTILFIIERYDLF